MTLIPYPHESAFEFMLKLFLDKWGHANEDLFVEYMIEYWVTPQKGRVHDQCVATTIVTTGLFHMAGQDLVYFLA